MSVPKLFTTEVDDNVLIIVPQGSVSSLAAESMKPELDEMLAQLEQPGMKSVVVDMADVSYFGTIMLGAMHMIWKRVRQQGGKMALCNVSVVGREVLKIAGFDTLWPMCPSREEAMDAVRV